MISIGFTRDDRSSSSLLSDCTKGLVGGFKAKFDDRDDDIEGALERVPSS